MRSFTDPTGATWDTAIEREGWGDFVLIFARRDLRDFRKAILTATNPLDAQHELDGLSEDDLRRRLEAAEPME